MNIRKFLILFLLGALPLSAVAGNIYRWVDDNGMVHYGDTVPDKYKDTATRKPELKDEHPVIDAKGTSEEQNARARAREILDDRPKPPAAPPAAPVAEPEPATAAPTASLTCQQQWAAYNASQACFATYRNANGSVQAEAFEQCTPVPEPPRCE